MNEKRKVTKKMDWIVSIGLLLWGISLNFVDRFNEILSIDIKKFISSIPFWLFLLIYVLFTASLYSFTYLRNYLSFRTYIISAISVLITSIFVFFSVFTRNIVLFIPFMLTMLVVILIQKRKRSEGKAK